MLSVVCWKWRAKPGYRSQFTGEHVNVLRNMVARHYKTPHRFICITDDPKGVDAGIEIVPLWPDLSDLPSPHGAHQPSCYRRLKSFSPEMASILGPRFVSLDLDTVITADLSPLWDRTEDFIIWGETDPRSWYNGSMFLMTAGARAKVWQQFDPKTSPRSAYRAGKFGSDQGWISYCLGPGEATWSVKDGVYSWRKHIEPNGGKLPENARVVMFHGKCDPDSYKAMNMPWVRASYQ